MKDGVLEDIKRDRLTKKFAMIAIWAKNTRIKELDKLKMTDKENFKQ